MSIITINYLHGTACLLSSMYLCRPTREAVESWKTLLSEDLPEFMSNLKKAVYKIDIDSEKELEDLLWEYTRLFLGPYKLSCPPWESVYTSSKRLMMQDAFDEVKDLYGEAGLTINSPEFMHDHVGMELNFMSVLYNKIDNGSESRLQYKDIAKRFLNEHLFKWIPQFTQDMETATDFPIYKALAQATSDFIVNAASAHIET